MNPYGMMGIRSKVDEVEAALRRARASTMGYSHVDKDGKVVVDTSDPEYIALQARITAMEAAISTVSGLAASVQAELSAQGVATIDALKELRERHTNTIQSGPVRAWDAFRLHRERPPEHGGYPHLLPSDLCKVETYKDFEDAIRSEMEAAETAVAPLTASLESISGFIRQARVALSGL